MTAEIAVSKTLSIRDCGLDEYWLQGRIAADPGILGLGDLEVVRREKQQSSGGKLDILLKDPNVYEEPEDEADITNASWWSNSDYTTSTLETAQALLKIVSPVYDNGIRLAYTESYISLRADRIHFRLFRSKGKSLIRFCVNDTEVDALSDTLKNKGMSLFSRELWDDGSTTLQVLVDRQSVEENADLFKQVAILVKKCWS